MHELNRSTRRLKVPTLTLELAGKLLGIRVPHYLILADENFYSIRETEFLPLAP